MAVGFNEPLVTFAAGARAGFVLKAGQDRMLTTVKDVVALSFTDIYVIAASGASNDLRVQIL